jgi:hypothetical protein
VSEKKTVTVRSRAARQAAETDEAPKTVDLVVEPGHMPDFGTLSPNVAAPRSEPKKVVTNEQYGLTVEHY